MQTLSMGFFKPQNGDTGDVFFPDLSSNFQQLNDHTHNGTNSQLLASTTQTITSGAWSAAAIGGGLYQQTVSMPAGFNYGQCQIWFQLSTGEYVYPSVTKVSSTSYTVYTNDNTLTYVAFYR